jgi:hypothetical protein
MYSTAKSSSLPGCRRPAKSAPLTPQPCRSDSTPDCADFAVCIAVTERCGFRAVVDSLRQPDPEPPVVDQARALKRIIGDELAGRTLCRRLEANQCRVGRSRAPSLPERSDSMMAYPCCGPGSRTASSSAFRGRIRCCHPARGSARINSRPFLPRSTAAPPRAGPRQGRSSRFR